MFCSSKMLEDGDTLQEEIEEYSSEDSSDEEESNDDDGWITPSNIDEMNKAMTGYSGEDEKTACTVGCLTTDFAMQVRAGNLPLFPFTVLKIFQV